jgi:hypothetical protein
MFHKNMPPGLDDLGDAIMMFYFPAHKSLSAPPAAYFNVCENESGTKELSCFCSGQASAKLHGKG